MSAIYQTLNNMTKLVVLVTVCLVGSMATTMNPDPDKPYYDLENARNLFHAFTKQHGKSYSRKEYFDRLEIFKESLKDINRRNAMYPKTVFAVNRFADLRPDELYFGLKPLNDTMVKLAIPVSSVAPATLDWRDKGAVTHVKDQGDCGSCYIFSAIGNIEGQYAIKHKQCLAFSEGQALDCLENGSCFGGGIMHEVMKNLAKRAGVMVEKDYPYRPAKLKCRENASKVVAHVQQGNYVISIHDEDTLLNTLAELGPLAVVIVAEDLQHYHKGILYPDKCKDGSLLHGMVLVGYGDEKGTKYWILKNSWGKKWGEKGYLRLLRGVDACRMGTSYTASAIVA